MELVTPIETICRLIIRARELEAQDSAVDDDEDVDASDSEDGFDVLGDVIASAKPRETLEQVTRIAQATAKLIGVGRELRRDELVLDDRYHAGTYGIPDRRTLDAIGLAARLEGMITDPVYEGKSMAALVDLVQAGRIESGSRVLYAHLGGQPALNAYAGAF